MSVGMKDDQNKVLPCQCGMVPRGEVCGIYTRWKKGTFGLNGSGCLALDFHRAYLYKHNKGR